MHARDKTSHPLSERHQALHRRIASAKRVLTLAVGGGNDSVSSLAMMRQLGADFEFAPDDIVVGAMLPDCLDYHGCAPTSHPLVHEILPGSSRSVQGRSTSKFPERVLAEHKGSFPGLPISKILGFSMREGSEGLSRALAHVAAEGGFDLALAVDVGGDFIAIHENIHVLSPMMDGYMLRALKALEASGALPMAYAVFGLGTDGETPPSMLREALRRIPGLELRAMEPGAIADIEAFHRRVVEPMRYSRTADFSFREIMGQGHPNPAAFRARFHVASPDGGSPLIHYGDFEHAFDEGLYAQYALFASAASVSNRFEAGCPDSLSWLMGASDIADRVNHELCGQAYGDLGQTPGWPELAGESLFVCTPSRKFKPEQALAIAAQSFDAMDAGVHSLAILWNEPGMRAMARARGHDWLALGEHLAAAGSLPALERLAARLAP
jgi:hypothetical protein